MFADARTVSGRRYGVNGWPVACVATVWSREMCGRSSVNAVEKAAAYATAVGGEAGGGGIPLKAITERSRLLHQVMRSIERVRSMQVMPCSSPLGEWHAQT